MTFDPTLTKYIFSRHATWYGLSVSNTDVGLFWDDTAVSRCDTDLRQITSKQFLNNVYRNKIVLLTTQLAFSAKYPKHGRFRLEHDWRQSEA